MEQAGKTTEERLMANEEQVTILKEDTKNADTQITDLQLAICELYENMGGVGMSYIAKVYAELIRKQEKTIDSVPESLKQEVQQLLNEENE